MLVDKDGALKKSRDVHRTFCPYSVPTFNIFIHSSLLAAKVIINWLLKGGKSSPLIGWLPTARGAPSEFW